MRMRADVAMRIAGGLLVALLYPLRAARSGEESGGTPRLRRQGHVEEPERARRTGTGFIVGVDGELVYIATASHVVEGDPKPQVTFYHDKRKPVAAEIRALEVDNPTAGLGYLIVRDRAVAEKVKALGWSAGILRGGEDVVAIGFGQGPGEWGVIKGTVASASGSDIRIDGRIEEGNSGRPDHHEWQRRGHGHLRSDRASASASRASSSRQRSGDGMSRSPRRHGGTPSLVGNWLGAPSCTLVFRVDNGKNVEGSCNSAGDSPRICWRLSG